MVWKFLTALLFVIATCSAAMAASSAVECLGTNTSVSSVTPLVVINTCNVTAGSNGIVVVTATATTTCAVDEFIQMFAGTGSSPVSGSTIPVPSSGVINITKNFHPNSCSTGAPIITVAGALDATTFGGGVGTAYWIGVAIYSSAGGAVTWNNNMVHVLTY